MLRVAEVKQDDASILPYPMPHISACVINECCPLGIKYEGVAQNKSHVNFLDQCLDRCMLGYLSDGNDKSLAADVNSYFASTVADAKRVSDKRKLNNFFPESGGSGKRLKRAKQELTDDTSSIDVKSERGSQPSEDHI